MTNEHRVLDRRHFLIKNAYLFLGSISGLSLFSKALASGGTEPKTPLNRPKVALIIDDIGFNRARLRQFLQLDIPITFAILPKLPKTKALAEEILVHDHETMLHQPMEPCNPNIDPGPGALYLGDDSNKIIDTVERNILEIPYIAGVNNHMGSKFTSSCEKMDQVLHIIKDMNLFFIDSLTTSHSAGYKTAKRLQMSTAFRNIFLDNIPEERYILGQLNRLKKHAIRTGHAIGIGHPYPITAHAIGSFLNRRHDPPISIVHASQLMSCFAGCV